MQNYVEQNGADAFVIMTQWNHYRGPDIAAMTEKPHGDGFIHLRNVYEPEWLRDLRFNYFFVGRC